MSCLLSLSFRFLLVTAVMLEGLCKIGWEKRLGADGEKVCGGTNARGLWLEAVVGGCGWGGRGWGCVIFLPLGDSNAYTSTAWLSVVF